MLERAKVICKKNFMAEEKTMIEVINKYKVVLGFGIVGLVGLGTLQTRVEGAVETNKDQDNKIDQIVDELVRRGDEQTRISTEQGYIKESIDRVENNQKAIIRDQKEGLELMHKIEMQLPNQ